MDYILNNFPYFTMLIKYREIITENKAYDKSMHCDYCGCNLKIQEDYCSEPCKQKDSVWHREDDV